jgi:hypothetical protein
LSFDAQWKFPQLQGHGTATLAGWIDVILLADA